MKGCNRSTGDVAAALRALDNEAIAWAVLAKALALLTLPIELEQLVETVGQQLASLVKRRQAALGRR